jgi:SAM-dependent methyltransferase
MREISDRLAELPAERRALLEQLLARETPSAAAYPVVATTSTASLGDPAKAEQRHVYDALNATLDAGAFGRYSYFLNYGYAATDARQYAVHELAPHVLNGQCIKLVLELIASCELNGRTILDVGCGRGGTAHVIDHYFEPAFVIGLDLSRAAVEFCASTHRGERLRFVEGDAEQLPFADGAFDVVTNVESSHAYPHVEAFYAEAARVLRAGGRFLYTDLRTAAEWAASRSQLERARLALDCDRDITTNVLRSCDQIASVHRGAFDERGSPISLDEFLAAPGSVTYESMRAGTSSYRILALTKQAEDVRAATVVA